MYPKIFAYNMCTFLSAHLKFLNAQMMQVDVFLSQVLFCCLVIKQMLDKGVDENSLDYGGRTTLHLAASEGHELTVEMLLK